MPLWLAPSSPVTPARSSTKVTAWPCRATSIRAWSKARLRKVAYSATTGCMPPIASPAAEVTACCSAMPTSKVRSGHLQEKACSPTGCSIAAVIATTSGRSAPIATISSENTLVQPAALTFSGLPVSGSVTGATLCRQSASSSTAGW